MDFCPEIVQRGLNAEYEEHVKIIAQWYIDTVQKYDKLLKTDLAINIMSEELNGLENDLSFGKDLAYHLNAKSSYFSVSDALVKLILSLYSYGPNANFLASHGITRRFPGESWMDCPAGELDLTEITAKILRDEGVAYSFDLQILMKDRRSRNRLTHTARTAHCLSAIRCYRTIRAMLVFLNPDYDATLPVLDYPSSFNYDEFLSEPCSFNFDDCTTVLVVASVHDVPSKYLRTVANLPWDLVLDFDGYSDCGGLLSQVEHNRIQREILYRDVAAGQQTLIHGTTLWYRCGEYQCVGIKPNYNLISGYAGFHKGLTLDNNNTRRHNLQMNQNTAEIIRDLLVKADSHERLVNIVVLSDDETIVRTIVNESKNHIADFFISWLGLSEQEEDSITQNWFDGDEDYQFSCFRHFSCLPDIFFQRFTEYSDNWPQRTRLKTMFSLPAGSERIVLGENDRNNLAPFFDVLYDGCEHLDDVDSEVLKDQFYHGNLASWNTISNDYAIWTKNIDDVNRMVNDVKTVLGKLQENGQKRLYFIRHRPGIGGTTLARQLAWKLHDDFAVLSVRNYDTSSIKPLLENLYDNVLKKSPIIILADDTLPNIQSLCDCVRNIDRRCILIVSCRNGSSIYSNYPQANFSDMLSISNQTVDKLRTRFRTASKLPPATLAQRDLEFNEQITGLKRTPFIIGLYYVEQDFQIEQYVERTLNDCADPRYSDAMACIALCDRYGNKMVPMSLIHSMLGLGIRDNFITRVPVVSSLITLEQGCYHFKHNLLGIEYLKKYSQRYYRSDQSIKNSIYPLTKKLIDVVANMNATNKLREDHIDLLINILIRNKPEIEDEQNRSQLLIDIGDQEVQRNLLEYLAKTFQPLADGLINKYSADEQDWTKLERLILRLVSHSYAHLGKMYSKGDRNPLLAQQMHMMAARYMPDKDPDVFHMAGCSILEKLRNIWDSWNFTTNPIVSAETYAEFDRDVDEAQLLFEQTCDFGSPSYGLPSMLDLLYRYMTFVCDANKSRNQIDKVARDIQDDRYWYLHGQFSAVLEDVDSYTDLGFKAHSRITDLRDKFNAQVMHREYGKIIQHYQNQVDRCRANGDMEGRDYALRGLIFARIRKAKEDKPTQPFQRTVENPRQLMEDISDLLTQPCDMRKYSSYKNHSRLYHYWMQLAKVVNVSIDRGLSMAKQWMSLEEQKRSDKNPVPYYYVWTLQNLNGLAGSSQALDDAKITEYLIQRHCTAGKFDPRKANRSKMRDLLIHGNGMGQLFDVTMHSDDEIKREIERRHLQPVEFYGHLGKFQFYNGLVELYDPVAWAGNMVWLETGKQVENTLSPTQIGHKIHFLAGFSVERMVALPNSAKDESSGERFVLSEWLGRAKAAPQESSTAVVAPKTSSEKNEGLGHITDVSTTDTSTIDDAPTQAKQSALVASGTVVSVVIDKLDPTMITGHFVCAGSKCKAVIKNVKPKKMKDLKKAYDHKKEVRCRVVGMLDSENLYSVHTV